MAKKKTKNVSKTVNDLILREQGTVLQSVDSPKPMMHPVLERKITRVLDAMHVAGMTMDITPRPVRTAEMQNLLYQQGRTKPGPKVTNADGYNFMSQHQIQTDGYGHAVDCHFIVDSKPTWEVPETWWNAYGALVQAVGLVWGGTFKSLIDRPHAELPKSF